MINGLSRLYRCLLAGCIGAVLCRLVWLFVPSSVSVSALASVVAVKNKSNQIKSNHNLQGSEPPGCGCISLSASSS